MNNNDNNELKKSRLIEEETDFSKITKDPIRAFPAIYPLFLVVLIAAGLFWLNSLDFTFINQNEDYVMPKEIMKKELQVKSGSITAGVELESIANPSDELLANGAELYKANCASCHGDEGYGDGAAGANLNPLPRNFHESDGWTNGSDIANMYKTLEEGIAENGMAAYDYMPVNDRFAIIHYIRTFAPFYENVTIEELETMDLQYSLTQGKQTPNTITVDMAIDKLSAENTEFEKLVAKNIENIEKSKDIPGYRIFDENYSDINIAVAILTKNGTWKDSKDDFIKMLFSTIDNNGFKVSIFKLTDTDMTTLHTYLSNLITIKSVSNKEDIDLEMANM